MIVSDFRGERDWEAPLRALRARHGVMAVEIVDPREQELVPAGDLWLVDPETGRQVHVDTRKRRVRDRFAQAAAAERDEVARALRRAGADHVVLSTAGDWLRDLRRPPAPQRGRAAGAPGAPRRAPPRGGHSRERCSSDRRRAARGGRMSFAEPILLAGLHPDPARDAGLRVAAAAAPARVRGVGQPRARART